MLVSSIEIFSQICSLSSSTIYASAIVWTYLYFTNPDAFYQNFQERADNIVHTW